MMIHYYPTQQREASQRVSAAKAAPKWGWVYALFGLLVLLFWVERRQPLTRVGHIAIQCGIVLVVYGLVALWFHINQAMLYTEHKRLMTRKADLR